MAATRRFAAFLPDWGCVLVASLAYVDPDLDHDRALYPCVREDCACAGVFYNCYGGSASQLRLRIWIEHAETSASSSSSSSSSSSPLASSTTTPARSASLLDAAVAEEVASFFKDRRPEVTLFNGDTSASSEVVSTKENLKWLSDPASIGGGSWEVTFRPSRLSGDTGLAQLKVCVGVNEVWTGGFEVRTKPSEWLLLQSLPASWTNPAEDVRTLMSACTNQPITSVVLRHDDFSTPAKHTTAGAGAGAAAASATATAPAAPAPRVAAFVRFANRAKACGALVGFKKLLRGRGASAKAVVSRTKSKAAPVMALPAGFEGVTVSIIASLNRTYKDDVKLTRVLLPSLAIADLVQSQARPSFLPPPLAVGASAAGAGAGAAPAPFSGPAASSPVASTVVVGEKRESLLLASEPVVSASKRVRVASPVAPVADERNVDSDVDSECDYSSSDDECDVAPVMPVALSTGRVTYAPPAGVCIAPPSPVAAVELTPPSPLALTLDLPPMGKVLGSADDLPFSLPMPASPALHPSLDMFNLDDSLDFLNSL